ncbi:hypothetical protein CC1G_08209 [Coprinopsis cinerea okayama7|uniref:Uncharacterized protein n=1 Tax=Coprinopsis cinerea (strain Okayama-7 / 130 / ATCC MYA-4618 / FGSC 9003) TaxID=240176 RepID=A8P7E3_COPC7|nr:hypothetical protein CC1G_08209 [Coprinopsis cinerea okayama7\|eukprot:XP_001839342.1 hypothetical protein CC1G_08209 [Coprinopsis cinerea okayama7\
MVADSSESPKPLFGDTNTPKRRKRYHLEHTPLRRSKRLRPSLGDGESRVNALPQSSSKEKSPKGNSSDDPDHEDGRAAQRERKLPTRVGATGESEKSTTPPHATGETTTRDTTDSEGSEKRELCEASVGIFDRGKETSTGKPGNDASSTRDSVKEGAKRRETDSEGRTIDPPTAPQRSLEVAAADDAPIIRNIDVIQRTVEVDSLTNVTPMRTSPEIVEELLTQAEDETDDEASSTIKVSDGDFSRNPSPENPTAELQSEHTVAGSGSFKMDQWWEDFINDWPEFKEAMEWLEKSCQ